MARPGAFLHFVSADDGSVELALAEPASHRLEYRIVTPEGTELTINQEAEIVLDDLDGSIRLVGIAQDIKIDSAGLVHAPTEPGLGAQIDFDLIRSKKIGVLS